MKIKYTGSYDQIQIYLSEFKCFCGFKRNEWKELPDKIGNFIIKNNQNFYAEHELIFNPEDFNKSGLKICLFRFGALGDLIQLVPLMKYFKKNSNCHFTLATSKIYVDVMKELTDCFDNIIDNSKMKKFDYDRIIFLDGALETDHSLTHPTRLLHRVKLYESFFGVNMDEYDFDLNISNEIIQRAKDKLNGASLQQNKMHSDS